MSENIPIPSGYDVYWEKWVDAYESDIETIDMTHEKFEEDEKSEFGIDWYGSLAVRFICEACISHQLGALKPLEYWLQNAKSLFSEYVNPIFGDILDVSKSFTGHAFDPLLQ